MQFKLENENFFVTFVVVFFFLTLIRTTLMMLTSVTMVTVLLFVDIQRCRSGKELLGSERGCDPVSNKNVILLLWYVNLCLNSKRFLLVIYLKFFLSQFCYFFYLCHGMKIGGRYKTLIN